MGALIGPLNLIILPSLQDIIGSYSSIIITSYRNPIGLIKTIVQPTSSIHIGSSTCTVFQIFHQFQEFGQIIEFGQILKFTLIIWIFGICRIYQTCPIFHTGLLRIFYWFWHWFDWLGIHNQVQKETSLPVIIQKGCWLRQSLLKIHHQVQILKTTLPVILWKACWWWNSSL